MRNKAMPSAAAFDKNPARAGFLSRRRFAVGVLLFQLLPLGRRHVLPAVPQLLLLVRRQLLVLLERVADVLLLVRRQLLESLVALPQTRAFLWREFAPALQPLLEAIALLAGHLAIAVGGVHEPMLALRRQGLPLVLLVVEELLLCGGERTPRDSSEGGGGLAHGRGCRCRGNGCRPGRQRREAGEQGDEQEAGLHRARLPTVPAGWVPGEVPTAGGVTGALP